MNDEGISLTAQQIADILRDQLGLSQTAAESAEDKEQATLEAEIEELSGQASAAQNPKPQPYASITAPQAWKGSPMQLTAARRKQAAEAVEQIAQKQERLDAIRAARQEREDAPAKAAAQAKEDALVAEFSQLQKIPVARRLSRDRIRLEEIKKELGW